MSEKPSKWATYDPATDGNPFLFVLIEAARRRAGLDADLAARRAVREAQIAAQRAWAIRKEPKPASAR